MRYPLGEVPLYVFGDVVPLGKAFHGTYPA